MIDLKKPFFNHTALKKRITESRGLNEFYAFDLEASAEAFANGPAAQLEPLSVVIPEGWQTMKTQRLMGFLADGKGRLVVRIASDEDAELIGAEVATSMELMPYIQRLMDLPFIEAAALNAQDRATTTTAALVKLRPYLKRRHAAPADLADEIDAMLDTIAQEDAEAEAARRKADARRK